MNFKVSIIDDLISFHPISWQTFQAHLLLFKFLGTEQISFEGGDFNSLF